MAKELAPVSFRLSAEERDLIAQVAGFRGQSVSSYIREKVIEFAAADLQANREQIVAARLAELHQKRLELDEEMSRISAATH